MKARICSQCGGPLNQDDHCTYCGVDFDNDETESLVDITDVLKYKGLNGRPFSLDVGPRDIPNGYNVSGVIFDEYISGEIEDYDHEEGDLIVTIHDNYALNDAIRDKLSDRKQLRIPVKEITKWERGTSQISAKVKSKNSVKKMSELD